MDMDRNDNGVTVLEENGSFRLVASAGRYAVVETRGGRVYGVPSDETGGREGAADDAEGVEAVARWTAEADARALLGNLAARGDQLARDLW
ncbi:hypothetical protein [Azospirillum doebereinerae]